MSADTLNKSLTPIDWLMTGPRPAANNGHAETKSCSKGPRKPPPVPVDLNAHLDPIDSNHYKYIDEKPSYSYATLIIFAINSSSQRRMTLSQIYEWITSNFTYYKDAHTGWKNSIRHNLSLNKCFKKVSRPKGEQGKGCYWEIDHSAVPQRSPEPDKTPLTPDSLAGSDPKTSPGPSQTLTELNCHNSFTHGDLQNWDSFSSGHSNYQIGDSAPQEQPQKAFSEILFDPVESFGQFYHTLLSNSMSVSDYWKVHPNELSLSPSAQVHTTSAGSVAKNQDLANLITIAEDIQSSRTFEAPHVERLQQAFQRGQSSRFGLQEKDFDRCSSSFHTFLDSWARAPQSSFRTSQGWSSYYNTSSNNQSVYAQAIVSRTHTPSSHHPPTSCPYPYPPSTIGHQESIIRDHFSVAVSESTPVNPEDITPTLFNPADPNDPFDQAFQDALR